MGNIGIIKVIKNKLTCSTALSRGLHLPKITNSPISKKRTLGNQEPMKVNMIRIQIKFKKMKEELGVPQITIRCKMRRSKD